MKKVDFVHQEVNKQKTIVVVRTRTAEKTIKVAETIFEAGLSLLDIPMTVPGALEVIKELSSKDGLILGAGAITSMTEATDAIDRGASFIVCPHTDRKIIDYCSDNGIFVAAGGLTPTEIMVAYLAGVDLVVVYPINVMGGVQYIKELLKPLPFLNLMPAGGVTLDEAVAHLNAGAKAVGITDALVDNAIIDREDYGHIGAMAKKFATAINSSATSK